MGRRLDKRAPTAPLTALTLIALVAGCGDDSGGPLGRERLLGDDDVGGQVVATVDGVGVTVQDIESLVASTGLSPQAALQRLEEEELLAAEAIRRGYDTRREVGVVGDRARVQRLLVSAIEEVVTPESIDEAAMRERYEDWRQRNEHPEKRSSLHFLVRVPEGAEERRWAAAETFADRVLGAARRGEHAEVFRRFEAGEEGTPPEETTFVVESLPAMAREELDPAYATALFSTGAEELHGSAVRSAFGVHVIFVQAIESEVRYPFEEVEERIREALVLEGRAALLEEVLERAARSEEVRVDEEVVERALSLEVDS